MKFRNWVLGFLLVSLVGCQSVETGFVDVDGGRIYRDLSGKQVYGIQDIEGDTYCFDDQGFMVHGFFKDSYFDESGRMVKGFYTIEDVQYYFDESGRMVKDTKMPYEGNRLARFDESGKMEVIADAQYLQNQVASIVSKYEGSVSVYFKDLASDEAFYLNPRNYYPCCMIKVPAAAALMEAIGHGEFSYEAYRHYIDPMIIVSDNTSFNKMMKVLGHGDGPAGMKRVNDLAMRLGLASTWADHGLRPGEEYFSSGGSNQSSAKDLGVIFEMIYKKQLVGSDTILNLLLQCDDDDELMRGLPAGTSFANKTGCAYALYHDGGIVYGPVSDYILVVFQDGVKNHQSMMEEISAFVYNYMNNEKGA